MRSTAKCVFPVLVGPRTARMRDDMADAMAGKMGGCYRLGKGGASPRGREYAALVERSALLSHRFRAPAERVWEALADTARYNEAAGFPRYTVTETAQPDGTQRFEGRARVAMFDVAWNNLP